uniref:NAD-dependent protein deacylase n=1 Tax=Rhodnius neglectus TaxID=72488 RepID=A0A0P4VPP7_9HEMI
MASGIAATKAELAKLKSILSRAKNIVVLTGAGISAESGIPTFRGPGGFWRTYRSQDLASVGAFKRNPSLVWEFYHYRRELVLNKQPNKAHIALAEAEKRLMEMGRRLTVITQNIDGLHQRAGSKEVVELHGSLYKTLCLKCHTMDTNYDSPICPSLQGRGDPITEGSQKDIPLEDLPRCKNNNCKGLLRPYIVWFGENLHEDTLSRADYELDLCDACLIVGSSSVVYPAAMYAPTLAARGIPVAEFNLESTAATHLFKFHFEGPCTETIPEVLKDIYDPLNINISSNKKNVSFAPHRMMSTDVKQQKPLSDDSSFPINEKLNSKDKDEGKASMKAKLKIAMRDYGATVIVFHIGISMVMLGGLYAAFSSGLELTWLIEKVGLSGRSGEIATGASTFVMAYAVNKVLAPVRFSITFACTPFLVRYLRSIGLLKPPKTPPSKG